MSDDNGRIKLTWPQVVWGISLLAAILGSWYDTRGQVALLRQEAGLRFQQSDAEHTRMWRAIDEAQAAPAPRNPRRLR